MQYKRSEKALFAGKSGRFGKLNQRAQRAVRQRNIAHFQKITKKGPKKPPRTYVQPTFATGLAGRKPRRPKKR